MTFSVGHVQGGTNAGKRVVRQQSKEDWLCPLHEGGCGKKVTYYWTSCPNCGHPRPDR